MKYTKKGNPVVACWYCDKRKGRLTRYEIVADNKVEVILCCPACKKKELQ